MDKIVTIVYSRPGVIVEASLWRSVGTTVKKNGRDPGTLL